MGEQILEHAETAEQPDTASPALAVERLTRAQRRALGKTLREKCPRELHGKWRPAAGRPDPVHLIEVSNKGRLDELVALRHGRMAQSPFTFYRGAALNMAHDLAVTPVCGALAQCCGDAHLANFGGFATAERNVIFAINDLDETLPAPWEWDLKRLSASFVLACRSNGLSDSTAKDMAQECARAYRKHMAQYSGMKSLDLWYYSLEAESLIASIADPAIRRRAIKRVAQEREHSTSEAVFPKLVLRSGESAIIREERPTIFHLPGQQPGSVEERLKSVLAGYRKTLSPAHRVLLDHFELKDAAIKVVGIGSVGTRCWVALLMDGAGDPLILQVKEARPSVLEAFAGKSVYRNHGERVVNGYRLMQPASDIFLGWTEAEGGHHFYVRQLRDVKITIYIETFGKAEMELYARCCGQSIALSHARSGDPSVISGYLGKSDEFDEAVAAFSMVYADQMEADHAAFKRAIDMGRLEAESE